MGRSRRHRSTRPKHRRKTRRQFNCHIPIQVHVSTSSYKPKTDFYNWVNSAWAAKATIPSYQPAIGVSDELEECIAKKTLDLIQSDKTGPLHETLQTLAASTLHSRAQHTSVDFLRRLLAHLDCISTTDDVVRHLGTLAKSHIDSVLSITFIVLPSKKVNLCIQPDPASLSSSIYNDAAKLRSYSHLLSTVGEKLAVPDLEKVIPIEKNFTKALNELYDEMPPVKLSLPTLKRRWPRFPWDIWFTSAGLSSIKSVYVRDMKFFKTMETQLHTMTLASWRLYLARIYILHSIRYLPPPFDTLHYEFFGRVLRGERIKMPQSRLLLYVATEYLAEPLSHLLWTSFGDERRVAALRTFTRRILESAKIRMQTVEWMHPTTREAAAAKMDAMRFEVGKPRAFAPFVRPDLDERCLLANIFELGRWNIAQGLTRIDKPFRFWEEGLFNVNAYYFNENNQIMIPYGTALSPFFDMDAPFGWNYGAIGCVIGHEICHGFDDDGKEYDPSGKYRRWWTKKDSRAYKRTTRKMIRLYDTTKVVGRSLNGEKTLSENIADNAGMGISLDALKQEIEERGLTGAERAAALRTFFIAYAVSWRTKTRPEKARTALLVDKHAPAETRVNLVVNQFDEFYEVFDVPEGSPMWRAPSARIRIF